MLALEEVIIDTHDDYTPWSCCSVGFDDEGNFVVRFDSIDYDDHRNDYTRDIVVEKEEALKMAQYLKVHLVGLPQHIEHKFGKELGFSTYREVEDMFKELMDYVLSCGVHYNIRRISLQL